MAPRGMSPERSRITVPDLKSPPYRAKFLRVPVLIRGILQAPEIQTMYSVPLPVSRIRTRIRQEFERHRFVNKLSVADVLIAQSHADYQVRNADGILEWKWIETKPTGAARVNR